MKKLSNICLCVTTVFVVLCVPIGGISAVLQFVSGDFARGFSDLFWACICVWVASTIVGIWANERMQGQ